MDTLQNRQTDNAARGKSVLLCAHVPGDLRRLLKVEAARRGTSASAIVIAALQAALAGAEP